MGIQNVRRLVTMAPGEKGDDGMGSVVLNISGGNCNITIVNKP